MIVNRIKTVLVTAFQNFLRAKHLQGYGCLKGHLFLTVYILNVAIISQRILINCDHGELIFHRFVMLRSSTLVFRMLMRSSCTFAIHCNIGHWETACPDKGESALAFVQLEIPRFTQNSSFVFFGSSMANLFFFARTPDFTKGVAEHLRCWTSKVLKAEQCNAIIECFSATRRQSSLLWADLRNQKTRL